MSFTVVSKKSWARRITVISAVLFYAFALFPFATIEISNSGPICQANINANKNEGSLTSDQLWDADIGCANGDHLCSEKGKLEEHIWNTECRTKCAQSSGGSQICFEFCSMGNLDC